MQQQPESGGEESWLEEQCHREIHGQHDEFEREFVRQRDNNLSTVWGAFQDSATAVAQLYRGKEGARDPVIPSKGVGFGFHGSTNSFFFFVTVLFFVFPFCLSIRVSFVCVCAVSLQK